MSTPKQKRRPSRFSKAAKIDPKQAEWILGNMPGYKTLAGRIDVIINEYRANHLTVDNVEKHATSLVNAKLDTARRHPILPL